jgi:hypothetical protein
MSEDHRICTKLRGVEAFMDHSARVFTKASLFWLLTMLAAAGSAPVEPALAQSTPTRIHTPPQVDPRVYSGRLKPDYRTPYEPASVQSIEATLQHVHAYLEQASPLRVVDGATGKVVPDLNNLPPQVALDRTDLLLLTYEWGVAYSGVLLTANVTGDARYANTPRRDLPALRK